MPDIQQANAQPESPAKANKYSLKATIARYKTTPIGLRRIVKVTATAIGGLVAVTFLHPSLPKAIFLTGSLLNLFIIIAIIVQAYIYVGQWDVMKRQLKTSAIGERAYIATDDMKLVKPLAANSPIVIRTWFKNGGKTPAWDFRSHYRAVVTPEDIRSVVKKYPVEREKGTGAFIIAGQIKRVECALEPYRIPPVTMAEIVSKRWKLFILTEITFRDYLEELREFSFRFVYSPETGDFEEADYDDSVQQQQ
jgi:hypothetical protein